MHEWLSAQVVSAHPKVSDDLELVIINPPRRGLAEGCHNLTKLKPKAILEISCKPESLRRDLTVFVEQGYNLVELQVFNMFPHTAHIETLALLLRDSTSAETWRLAKEPI